MSIKKWFEILSRFIIIGSIILIPNIVKADYEVFSINPIPSNQSIALPLEYQMIGHANGERWDTVYVADTKVTQFDRVTIPFCRYLGANGGVIDLEVRTTSTSSPIVASSTLVVNSGNVWSTGCTVGIINATTSTWVLNNNVQWEIGSNIWLSFYPRGTTGTFYYSFKMDGLNGYPNYNNGVLIGNYFGKTYNFSAKGYALGIPPQIYSASSSNVSCSTFDIGCYIGTAFSFLFIPSISPSEQFAQAPSIGSSTPFSYLYQMSGYVTTLRNGTASNTSLIIPFNGQDLTVFNTADIESYLGGDTSVVRDTFGYMIWLLALFVAYREIYSIFHKKQDDN